MSVPQFPPTKSMIFVQLLMMSGAKGKIPFGSSTHVSLFEVEDTKRKHPNNRLKINISENVFFIVNF